jgi:acetyl-CoA acetyltransferase
VGRDPNGWEATVGRKVFVVGVGMTRFEKPGAREGWDYPDMAKEAGTAALEDAGVPYDLVEQAAVGYVYGESTAGQRAVYELGLTGIPVYNVNNNCSTGSTALMMARQFVEGGLNECVLALGFEKMQKGSLKGAGFDDRVMPLDKHYLKMGEVMGFEPSPPAPQIFGNAGREHMQRYGTTPETFARIAEKNHRHSADNPYAQFRDVYSLEEILDARMIHDPLTKLQCSPTSDGAGAAVLASEAFVREHGLEDQAIEIAAQAMVTDTPATFGGSMIDLVGADMSRKAAQQVFERSGRTIDDVDVIELHDCFSANELITYEALGLAAEGEGGKLVDADQTTFGGKVVVNPSGGLISKGHPLGATGLAQCSELTWQLRGTAGPRQVEGAEVALQHNIGLGGAAVVTLYTQPTF